MLMKKLLFKISTLTITFISIIVYETLMSKTVSAYCVYNKSNTTITVFQLPLSERSFKSVIPPNENRCCNWKDTTCVASEGRYAKTPFLIYQGNVNKDNLRIVINDAVTAGSYLKKINSDLEPLIQNILSTSGIPPITSDIAEKIYSSLDKFVSKNQALGVVQTYNGGDIFYNGSVPLGCWMGPCKDQDINQDGTRGPNAEI